jgi:hypothetical protein
MLDLATLLILAKQTLALFYQLVHRVPLMLMANSKACAFSQQKFQ